MSDYPRVMEQVFPHDPADVDVVRRAVARQARDASDELVLLGALGLEP